MKLRFMYEICFANSKMPYTSARPALQTRIHPLPHKSLHMPAPSKPNTETLLHPLLLSLNLFSWSSLRPISTGQHMHHCTYTSRLSTSSSGRGLSLSSGYLILRGASRLDAFSVYPCQTWLPCHGVGPQQVHQRSVHPGPLVLRTAPLKYPAPAPDRDRTVSRRSEPSSRTALMGEQPNPWDLRQPQDAMSRHRGAKPLRRCELLGVISLLSPG